MVRGTQCAARNARHATRGKRCTVRVLPDCGVNVYVFSLWLQQFQIQYVCHLDELIAFSSLENRDDLNNSQECHLQLARMSFTEIRCEVRHEGNLKITP